MSKSDDNTNELESYGVWVKNSGNSENTENPSDPSDELNLDDVNLDLPDFDDSDFSDMFKDQPLSTDEAALDDFGSEDDTTLSTDELANITDGFEVEQVDAPAESDVLILKLKKVQKAQMISQLIQMKLQLLKKSLLILIFLIQLQKNLILISTI